MRKLRNCAASQNKGMSVTEIADRSGFPELPDYVLHSQDFCPRGKMFLHTWMNFEANHKKVNEYGTLTHVVTTEDVSHRVHPAKYM